MSQMKIRKILIFIDETHIEMGKSHAWTKVR